MPVEIADVDHRPGDHARLSSDALRKLLHFRLRRYRPDYSGSVNATARCVPSQKGYVWDAPQRQRVKFSVTSIGLP